MTGKLLIFDFDGVLADTFDTFYPLIRDAMKSIGLSLAPDQYRNFFISNVHQSLKDFIGDDKKHQAFVEFRNSKYDEYYSGKYYKARLFPEATNFLEEIGKNHILTIASSGRENNIKNLLEENGILSLFNLVLANSATSKSGMIKEILNKLNSSPENVTMITDTIGDINIAKEIGLKTIAVTWGFQSTNTLRSAKPDLLANSFKDIVDNI